MLARISSFHGPLGRCFALLSLAFLLTGCGKTTLFNQLGEQEANEMMAILLQREIACVKEPGKEEKWILRVPAADFARAVEVLKVQGYPRDKFANMGEIFQKAGLVSSPTEERIRYMYALSQEISDTLMRIDGVLNARVHIVIPNNDPLAEKVSPASCAVFIRYKAGFDLEGLTPQLKSLVMRSIEGLNHDNVSLVLVPASGNPTAANVPPPMANRSLPNAQVAGAAAAATLLVVGTAWFVQRRFSRPGAGKPVPA